MSVQVTLTFASIADMLIHLGGTAVVKADSPPAAAPAATPTPGKGSGGKTASSSAAPAAAPASAEKKTPAAAPAPTKTYETSGVPERMATLCEKHGKQPDVLALLTKFDAKNPETGKFSGRFLKPEQLEAFSTELATIEASVAAPAME